MYGYIPINQDGNEDKYLGCGLENCVIKYYDSSNDEITNQNLLSDLNRDVLTCIDRAVLDCPCSSGFYKNEGSMRLENVNKLYPKLSSVRFARQINPKVNPYFWMF